MRNIQNFRSPLQDTMFILKRYADIDSLRHYSSVMNKAVWVALLPPPACSAVERVSRGDVEASVPIDLRRRRGGLLAVTRPKRHFV